ncbi:MAG: glycosyltransferase [Magnetococcus sp. YQC-9]
MQEFIQTVFQLDAEQDLFRLHDFVRQYEPDWILIAMQKLFAEGRLRSAYLLAMLLDQSGYRHFYISLALGAGAILFNQPETKARALEMLWTQTDGLSDQERLLFELPFLGQCVTNGLLHTEAALTRMDLTEQLLELCRAVLPQFRNIFDCRSPMPVWSWEELRQKGRAKAKLVDLRLPPSGSPRQRRKVLIFQRETQYPIYTEATGNTEAAHFNFRTHLSSIGPGMAEAMNAYGWEAESHPVFNERFANLVDCVPFILELCRMKKPDIVIFEHDIPATCFRLEYEAMIAQLRQEHPGIKLVANVYDNWCLPGVGKVELLSQLDVIWDPILPSWEGWRLPELADKVLFAPFWCLPEGYTGSTQQPLYPVPVYDGSVTLASWPRLLWQAAIHGRRVPIRRTLASHKEQHKPDGLSAMESFRRYLQRIEESTCCFVSVMRNHQHANTLVGRSFETQCAGALLILESTPEMDYHFIEGEHYLAVSSVAELAAAIGFMIAHPFEAEEIRRQGHAFAHARYGNEQLIGYLDYRLYWAAR